MRTDMSKVIVERPRRHGGGESARIEVRCERRAFNNARDFDEAPYRGPMSGRRRFGYAAKVLNENLRPLKRFIAANVGRPWNAVHSEIRASLRMSNAVQLHVIQHLWQIVDRHDSNRRSSDYYVDQRTGLLRRRRR